MSPTATQHQRRRPTEAERQQKRAAERELMAEAIEALRSSEGWQHWLTVRRHFRTYSLHNQLLIAHQRPGSTRVAGFRAWLKLGYAVRKGERGIRIWAPSPPSAKRLAEWRQAGADPAEKPPTYFRLVAVFDRSQVDSLPDFPGGPVDLEPPIEPIAGAGLAHLFGPLAEFGEQIGSPVAIEAVPGAANGYYEPATRRIVIDLIDEQFSANAQVATLIHELAHALVRCDRSEEDPKLSYAEEEVVVESAAYTVCGAVGLDTSGFSVPYLTGWSESAGGAEAIERYAALIDRVAGRLEDAALGADVLDGPIAE